MVKRKWVIEDQSGKHLYTEDDILKEYWGYWSERMRCLGRPLDSITHEHCIDDWALINLAVKASHEDHPRVSQQAQGVKGLTKPELNMIYDNLIEPTPAQLQSCKEDIFEAGWKEAVDAFMLEIEDKMRMND